MAKKRLDGVIEAVHYDLDGNVKWVRAYLRRGATFSDRTMVNRETLIEFLKSGKQIYAGQRIPLQASTFELSNPVRLIQEDGYEVLVVGTAGSQQDKLEGVPII